MQFESTVRLLGDFPAFPPEVIRVERSMGRVPIPEAMHAGPAHRAFIAALPQAWRDDPDIEIFSRSLWLKTGWYPLTPHYHIDWEAGADGPVVETIMVLLGDVSRTEFVLGALDFETGEKKPDSMMQRWAAQVETGVRAGRLKTWLVEPEKLVWFDNRSLHRARAAQAPGWRILMRAIRGMPKAAGDAGVYRNPGRFTTIRNGYLPETDEERQRYAPYRL